MKTKTPPQPETCRYATRKPACSHAASISSAAQLFVFIPQFHPFSVSPFARLNCGKSYVAYDNASAFCKKRAGQSLKESHLSGKVKLVENIGGYDSVKRGPELGWPLAQ